MWAGNQPSVTAEESAKVCALGVGDPDLRQRVTDANPEFAANSAKLQEAAASGKLYGVTSIDFPISNLSPSDLLWLYDAQLAKKRRPAYKIRDKIMSGAPHGLCLYCRHGQAKTLDHFIPKSLIPGLAIDPWNLVPACFDCNHGLSNHFSDQPTEQMLHPYFMPPLGRWLTASVDHSDPVVVQFAATPGESLPAELQMRIRYQFKRLDLGLRYSILCAGEVAGLNRRLEDQFRNAAFGEVSAYLSELALLAFGTDPNDRRAVMYEALAADAWYCKGGYAGSLIASRSASGHDARSRA